jgi:hypothetical protein
MAARNRYNAPRETPRKYYIYHPGVGRKLGGFPVRYEDSGESLRYVMLTADQAAYWMASGTVGEKPLAQLTETERHNVHQLTGGRVTKVEGEPVLTHQIRTMGLGKFKSKLIKVSTARNAVQDAATMADGLRVGNSPGDGRRADRSVTPEQRAAMRTAINNPQRIARGYHEGLTPEELRNMK